jgi:hypothetical protein
LAEFGITAAQGREGIKELLAIVAQEECSRLPVDPRDSARLFWQRGKAMSVSHPTH